MSAPFGQPSYAELAQQVSDLADAFAKPLTLDELPLGDLRKQLIDNGDPLDLSVLGLAGQITKETLGVATMTWPGGTPNATTLVVLHGLEVQPTKVFLTPDQAGPWTVNHAGTFTPSQFTLVSRDVTGASPAIGTTQLVYWRAVV